MKPSIYFSSLLFFCLLACSGLQAQVPAGKSNTNSHWRLGFTNGLNLNKFTSEQPHTGYSLGYNAAIFADLQLGKGWFVRGLAGYSGFGGELVTFKDDTRYGYDNMFTFKNVKQSRYTLLSIDAAAAFFYTIPSKQPWKLALGLGGGFANQFGEHESYEKTGEFITGVYGTVTGNQFTDRFEGSWGHADAHIDLLLPAKKINWHFQGSYLMGLSTVRSSYSYIEYAGVTGAIRTTALQFKVGISKNLRKKSPKTKN